MASTILPEKPIPLRVARDWSSYEKNLDATPLVREHLREILKGRVENSKIQNPLALPWLRVLIDGNLRSLEKHLAEFKSYMGEPLWTHCHPSIRNRSLLWLRYFEYPSLEPG